MEKDPSNEPGPQKITESAITEEAIIESAIEEKPEEVSAISNKLLAKYSNIWVWSIVIGLNSGLTYSLFNYRQSNYILFAVIIAVIYGSALLLSLYGWVNLGFFLKKIVIPIMRQGLFVTSNVKPEQNNAEVDYAYIALNKAFRCVIYAFAIRFVGFLLELFFSAIK